MTGLLVRNGIKSSKRPEKNKFTSYTPYQAGCLAVTLRVNNFLQKIAIKYRKTFNKEGGCLRYCALMIRAKVFFPSWPYVFDYKREIRRIAFCLFRRSKINLFFFFSFTLCLQRISSYPLTTFTAE